MISTSYGINDTVYYVYEEADALALKETLDGANVYCLYDHIKEIKAPAMGEDLDYYDGQIITLQLIAVIVGLICDGVSKRKVKSNNNEE